MSNTIKGGLDIGQADNKTIVENFGRNLQQLRKATGYDSQKAFAQVLGITNAAIANYEGGKRAPDFLTLMKISRLLKVKIDYLICGDSQEDDFTSFADFSFDRFLQKYVADILPEGYVIGEIKGDMVQIREKQKASDGHQEKPRSFIISKKQLEAIKNDAEREVNALMQSRLSLLLQKGMAQDKDKQVGETKKYLVETVAQLLDVNLPEYIDEIRACSGEHALGLKVLLALCTYYLTGIKDYILQQKRVGLMKRLVGDQAGMYSAEEKAAAEAIINQKYTIPVRLKVIEKIFAEQLCQLDYRKFTALYPDEKQLYILQELADAGSNVSNMSLRNPDVDVFAIINEYLYAIWRKQYREYKQKQRS